MYRHTSYVLAVAFLIGIGEVQATVIADARTDFVSGTTNGDLGIVPASGTGEWRYLASDTANPTADPVLDVLSWEAFVNQYRKGTCCGSMDAVSLNIGGIAPDELGLHPSAFGRSPSFVAVRWIAGAGEAGVIDIAGNVRLSDPNGPGSISFDLFVDANPLFGSSLVINDLVGAAFHQTATVGVGSTVDFVVGPNGFDTYDSTGLKALISTVPEPATLALLGFGLAGLALSRRKNLSSTHTHPGSAGFSFY